MQNFQRSHISSSESSEDDSSDGSSSESSQDEKEPKAIANGDVDLHKTEHRKKVGRHC